MNILSNEGLLLYSDWHTDTRTFGWKHLCLLPVDHSLLRASTLIMPMLPRAKEAKLITQTLREVLLSTAVWLEPWQGLSHRRLHQRTSRRAFESDRSRCRRGQTRHLAMLLAERFPRTHSCRVETTFSQHDAAHLSVSRKSCILGSRQYAPPDGTHISYRSSPTAFT